LERKDLWYLSKDKIEAKKHPNYKLLKRFASSYYQETFTNLSQILQVNLSHQANQLINTEFLCLRLKILSVFECFGWTSNLSISTYIEVSESIPALCNHLRNEATKIVRFFMLPKKQKIDQNLSESSYIKIVRDF